MSLRGVLLLLLAVAVLAAALADPRDRDASASAGRREVVFWHFWGGKDRAVVEEVVARFNASQQEHFVRAVAMPGQNLDLKFFLGVAGGDPPDLLNQDDPVVADWAARGAIRPLDEIASADEVAQLPDWLFPAAREIGTYDGRLYALCNGLDIRALYCDARALEELGRPPPRTLAELDELARLIAPPEDDGRRTRFGYLPDPRRLWAWGIVFGGEFYDPSTGEVTADSERVVAALEWMASYGETYGRDEVQAFRTGDQALSGASFPLLEGRYAMIMDGQWRVAEMDAAIAAARAAGKPEPRYGVVPLPPPPGGRERAGWVNGNFFVVPRGADNPEGAWAFMKFWSGFGGNEGEAAQTAAAGGWIPASQRVVEQPAFEEYLRQHPTFRAFVDLAGSPHQRPIPVVPGAAFFQSAIVRAAEDAMYLGVPPHEALRNAAERVRRRLEERRPGATAVSAARSGVGNLRSTSASGATGGDRHQCTIARRAVAAAGGVPTILPTGAGSPEVENSSPRSCHPHAFPESRWLLDGDRHSFVAIVHWWLRDASPPVAPSLPPVAPCGREEAP